MSSLIVAGMVIVLGVLLTLSRMDLLKFLGYATVVDVIFAGMMLSMFHETFSGIVASSFAAVFMTIMLYVLRATVGCKQLRIVMHKGIPRIRWVYFGPENYRGKWSKAQS